MSSRVGIERMMCQAHAAQGWNDVGIPQQLLKDDICFEMADDTAVAARMTKR